MIHSKWLTVEVCGELRLRMAGRRQVERHIVWVGIPRGIEIELPVNDWTFPITPEIGGAGCTWAQTVLGVACTASKVTNTRRNSGCFMKIFFQLPVVRTLAVYNIFSRVMVSSPMKFVRRAFPIDSDAMHNCN